MQKNSYHKNGYVATLTLIISIILIFSSCRKFIETEAPYTSFSGENVYGNDATAISAVTGIYSNIYTFSINNSGIASVSFFAGLSADELTLNPNINASLFPNHPFIYSNNLSVDRAPSNLWTSYFQLIYPVNAAIEGLNLSTGVSEIVKRQLLGEAKFLRGFCFFYLTNLYGDVPLVLTTDYKTNSLLPRTASSEVWSQIIKDLQEAKGLLSEKFPRPDLKSFYSDGSEERVRPTKWAAIALLSRVYLYINNWIAAEAESSEIINNSPQFGLVSLAGAFIKNNKESILQIQPTTAGRNTMEGLAFVLPPTGPNTASQCAWISKRLLNSFESTDIRKTSWLDSVKVGTDTFYYAHKYKVNAFNAPVTEYSVFLRLAEQYLIRAEARANQENIAGAQSDLNLVRNRAGLGVTIAGTKDQLIDVILRERRAELFTEWGHRWFDLKRTNTIDDIMSIEAPLKGGSWEPFDRLYPINNTELLVNPNLTQTNGY